MSEHEKTAESAGPDEDFLTRWSRRKSEAELAEAGPEAPAAPAEETAPPEVDESELTDADMPPIEELDEDSDVSPFMSAGVSEALRKAALKKLFHSAKFNVCDGLDDYAEDYTKFAPLGDVITADMRHQMERALEKLAADKDDGRDGDESRPSVAVSGEDAAAADIEAAASDREAGEELLTEGEDDAGRA